MIRLLMVCLLCFVTVGCFSTKYVEQKQYLLNIKTLPEKKITHNKCTIFVERITAAVPFDQYDFLYRIKSDQYLTDYYNGFLVSPSQQLEPVLINYLKVLGNCDLDTVGLLTTPNRLQVQIAELYADYRDSSHPQAVIGLRFILTKVVDGKTTILFDKILYNRVALKEKSTTGLLSAWNIGLQDVLKRGVKTLNVVLRGISK